MARPENPHMSLEEWAQWIAKEAGLENLSDETIAQMMIGLREFETVVI